MFQMILRQFSNFKAIKIFTNRLLQQATRTRTVMFHKKSRCPSGVYAIGKDGLQIFKQLNVGRFQLENIESLPCRYF